jgi:hypothetical protein
MECFTSTQVMITSLLEYQLTILSIAGSSTPVVSKFKTDISGHFKITDLGEINFLLGFAIKRDLAARTISINQRAYINTIMERFNMRNAKPTYTPMDSGLVLSKYRCPTTSREFERMRNVPFRAALCANWYLATTSRPDITYALSTINQFADNPGEIHWEALRHHHSRHVAYYGRENRVI